MISYTYTVEKHWRKTSVTSAFEALTARRWRLFCTAELLSF